MALKREPWHGQSHVVSAAFHVHDAAHMRGYRRDPSHCSLVGPAASHALAVDPQDLPFAALYVAWRFGVRGSDAVFQEVVGKIRILLDVVPGGARIFLRFGRNSSFQGFCRCSTVSQAIIPATVPNVIPLPEKPVATTCRSLVLPMNGRPSAV